MPRTKKDFEAMRESTRQKIEATALSLFARKGLAVTVSEIVKAAELSQGLLYSHYQSKEALISELIHQAATISSQGLNEIAQGNISAILKIQQITSMMCQMFSEQNIGIDYFMFMVQVGMSGFQTPKAILDTNDLPNPVESLALIISQGQTEGSIVDGDPIHLATIYWATVQGLCCYAITGTVLSPDSQMLNRILLKESYL